LNATLREDGRFVVNAVGVACSKTPGRATVPRAELWAAILAVRSASVGSTLAIHPDALYVHRGIIAPADGKKRLESGRNGDLWTLLFSAVREKNVKLLSRRVSSHLDGEMVLAGEVNITDFVGNLLADIGAGIPTDGSGHAAESRYMEMWEARAFLVARRLAIIEAQIWQRGEMLVPEPAPREPCATPVEESVMNDTQLEVHERGHRLIKYGSGTKCTRCRVQRKVGGYRFWTTVDCRGADRKRTLATQVDEVGSDVDAVNTTRGSEPPDELGLGQVDPAGFDDPEGGEWQAAASGFDEDGGSPTEDGPGEDEGEGPRLVPLGKRRRILRQQRDEARREKIATAGVVSSAWARLISELPLNANGAGPDADDVIPFKVHDSHASVHCGGYVGCIRCGTVVSSHTHGAISRQCRRVCPAGSKGPVLRLVRGRLPRGEEWPNGEVFSTAQHPGLP
jgi:hypothetical protein